MAASAAELLRSRNALSELSLDEARLIVGSMRLLRCAEGGVLMREGEDASAHAFMLLILEGEVTVENMTPSRKDSVVVSVLGPGHLLGETSLIDGGPRTATCTATTPVLGAGLSRHSLRRLSQEHPAVALKLLAAMAQRMAQRLRDNTRQQRIYHQLIGAMQGEIDELQRQLQQVMDGALNRSARPADH